MRGRIPRRMRMLAALRPEPDWDTITPAGIAELRAAQAKVLRSPLGAVVGGRADRGASISTQSLELPGRTVDVRVHRPRGGEGALPLIVAFHGGGLIVGTPAQDDWLLSHLAARCGAVVASVDYRLAPEHPVPAPVHDAYDAFAQLVDRSEAWGVDPRRVALLGSSAGATLAALTAIEAVARGRAVRTQVLINPQLDWTDATFEYPSFLENADAPTATPANCRAAQRIALPPSFDPAAISPLYHPDLAGVAPALIVSAGLDTLEDHSPAYAARLRAANVAVTLTRHAEATHAFLSMPGLVPAARPARAEILTHLVDHLAEQVRVPR
ncbi:alpha/beta hydrolase [Nocardia asteroides]|uniref:alpha/beta hydrolase n=1 Tax=Nocardia asteroides TaxID=1824 RepID=UPI001E36A728|nr:alpha/beta hydrolase [Nocardia asteroides]UGT56443.1 alpha/beta hydrolase [Nocardia asteroides]